MHLPTKKFFETPQNKTFELLLRALVSVETLVGVADEGQRHLGGFLRLSAVLDGLGLEDRRVIGLVDFISGEVGRVNVGGEARLERCADATQAVKLDATEEGMVLDLVCTSTAKTVLRVADHTGLR